MKDKKPYFIGSVLDTENESVSQERFNWPIWVLFCIIFLYELLVPRISHHSWEESLCDLYTYIGFGLVAVRYIWGWLKRGEIIDWYIYVFLLLFMPFVARVFVRYHIQLYSKYWLEL